MKLLNLINRSNSDIPYEIFHFPDGEVQISLTKDLDRKDSVKVLCRITSAEELFLVMQVGDILDRQEIEWDLYITYLMSMRMDRVMDFNRPFTLKVVCNMLNSLNYNNIYVLEAHSNRTHVLLKDSPWKFDYEKSILPYDNIVYPDHGAYERYKSIFGNYGHIIFGKERDLETGKIVSFQIVNIKNCYSDTFVFIDDLCDGGGTFLGELQVLKEQYPNAKFSIIVCHAVNESGINKLCDNFDKVIISNSYKNWDIKRDNLTIIDICEK